MVTSSSSPRAKQNLQHHLHQLYGLRLSIGGFEQGRQIVKICPNVVSEKEPPSALVLTALLFDLSAVIGSALAGAVIPLVGTDTVFAVDSAAFLLVSLVVLWWERSKVQAHAVMENFFQSFATAARYVRCTPGMQIVLARQILFSVLVAAVPALLPVVGLTELHIGAAKLGLLYTSMGIGSVVAAGFILPWGRAHYSPNTLTRLATYFPAPMDHVTRP